MQNIIIKGAKENNLKNIDLIVPRNKIVCFVGVSGSGKSTLAFDIIAKEARRQYFESLPSFARRYLQKINRPVVEEIKGISSTIIISQDRVIGSPRSTIGTLTEAYSYLRMLFARVGLPALDSSYFSFNHPNGACPKCKGLGKSIELDISKLIDSSKSLNEGALLHSAWKVGGRMWNIVRSTNFYDMDKKISDFEPDELDKLLYAPKQLWQDESDYGANKWTYQGIVTRLQGNIRNDHDKIDYSTMVDCSECNGLRLNKRALSVKINDKNIGEVGNLSLIDCLTFIKSVNSLQAIAIRPKLEGLIQSMVNAGIGYLSLNRSTDTLSGGEAQRVKLAKQMGCDLIETIYVLDEPTSGLHPRDIDRVVDNLKKLRDNGNTVLVVEHDEYVIKNSDYIIEVGPGGGKNGGNIIAQGNLDDILSNSESVTAPYLLNVVESNIAKKIRQAKGSIRIEDAHRNNLKNISLDIPTGILIALTGVSGSGKSSLIEEILAQHGDKIVNIDQAAVGNNRRGCVGTYTGIFDLIRKIFAQENNLSESLFSYNTHGACDECKGIGYIDMDMNFLGNVQIHCESCDGTRYKKKVLRYKYKDNNIVEVLKMTASEIISFFNNPDISRKAQLLVDVGLDYLEIGQTLDTLSGGEAQRLKLASKLQNRGEFYILDEPTSGLHFQDIEKLLVLLNRLVDNGNTVLVVEHNLNIIKNADWVIDLGPEGGSNGGNIVSTGTVNAVSMCAESYTGEYLRKNV